MVISSDQSTAQIAKDLGIKATTLYSWVKQAKLSNSPDAQQCNEQLFDEVKRLKKELIEVKEQLFEYNKTICYSQAIGVASVS